MIKIERKRGYEEVSPWRDWQSMITDTTRCQEYGESVWSCQTRLVLQANLFAYPVSTNAGP